MCGFVCVYFGGGGCVGVGVVEVVRIWVKLVLMIGLKSWFWEWLVFFLGDFS